MGITGGVTSLFKIPAGDIQVLGAEKCSSSPHNGLVI